MDKAASFCKVGAIRNRVQMAYASSGGQWNSEATIPF